MELKGEYVLNPKIVFVGENKQEEELEKEIKRFKKWAEGVRPLYIGGDLRQGSNLPQPHHHQGGIDTLGPCFNGIPT